MTEIILAGLEEKVKEILGNDPHDTIEILGLSEDTFNKLKKVFGYDYFVNGVVSINGINEGAKTRTYSIHISRKKLFT